MTKLRLVSSRTLAVLLTFAVFFAPGSVLAAPIPVAIVSYDFPEWLPDVQSKLLATGAFTTVDILGGQPTLSQMQAYPAVLAWDFDNQPTFGDALADYVDAGGGVVVMTFSLTTSYSSGRFATDNYFAIQTETAQLQGGPLTMNPIFTPAHPILDGVTSFDGGSSSYRVGTTALHPSAVRVANWSDGNTLIASRKIGGTRRADLNFFPVSSDIRVDFWNSSSDGTRLMKNALLWVANELPACGDGELDAGEECDDGGASGCCDSNCELKSAGEACFDDDNGCTDDLCDAGGVCLHPDNSAPCDDGVFCNGVDACAGGSCSVHPGDPCLGNSPCNRQCNETSADCFDSYGVTCDRMSGITCSQSDLCDGSGTCLDAGGGDPDGDLICSADDNCPSDSNPNQSDIDGNGGGDVCSLVDAYLNVTRVQVKSSKSDSKPSGSIVLRGSFLTTPVAPSNDVFSALSGLTVRVSDMLDLDYSSAPSFGPTECAPPNGAGVVKCASTDKRYSAKFVPTAPGGPVYTFSIKMKKIQTPASLFGPVTVILTSGSGVDRFGQIPFCAPSAGKLFCRTL